MSTETPARPWDTADDWSMWEITGTYPTKPGHGQHSFTACLAVVVPRFTHGTDRPLFLFVGPLADLNDPVDPTWISDARPLLLVDAGDPTQAYWEHDQAAVDDGLGREVQRLRAVDQRRAGVRHGRALRQHLGAPARGARHAGRRRPYGQGASAPGRCRAVSAAPPTPGTTVGAGGSGRGRNGPSDRARALGTPRSQVSANLSHGGLRRALRRPRPGLVGDPAEVVGQGCGPIGPHRAHGAGHQDGTCAIGAMHTDADLEARHRARTLGLDDLR